MSYEEFFQLREQPFSNAPVSRYYFNSSQHSQALLRLKHAARSNVGLAVLVGDIGAGKTTLARRLLDELDEREFESALLVIVHSAITAEWLLRKIAAQLGVEENPEGEARDPRRDLPAAPQDPRAGAQGGGAHRRGPDAAVARADGGVPRPAQPRGAGAQADHLHLLRAARASTRRSRSTSRCASGWRCATGSARWGSDSTAAYIRHRLQRRRRRRPRDLPARGAGS